MTRDERITIAAEIIRRIDTVTLATPDEQLHADALGLSQYRWNVHGTTRPPEAAFKSSQCDNRRSTARLQTPIFPASRERRKNGYGRRGSPHGDDPSAGRGAECSNRNSSKAARTSYNSRHALRKSGDNSSRHAGVAALPLDDRDAEAGDTARLTAQF